MVGFAIGEEDDDSVRTLICSVEFVSSTVEHILGQIQAVVRRSRAGGIQFLYRPIQGILITGEVNYYLGFVITFQIEVIPNCRITPKICSITVIRKFDDRDTVRLTIARDRINKAVDGFFHGVHLAGNGRLRFTAIEPQILRKIVISSAVYHNILAGSILIRIPVSILIRIAHSIKRPIAKVRGLRPTRALYGASIRESVCIRII